VSICLRVLALVTAYGLLDSAVHRLTVAAIVNRWIEDDLRWDLLPVVACGVQAMPEAESGL
jgi:hypothetical protein